MSSTREPIGVVDGRLRRHAGMTAAVGVLDFSGESVEGGPPRSSSRRECGLSWLAGRAQFLCRLPSFVTAPAFQLGRNADSDVACPQQLGEAAA